MTLDQRIEQTLELMGALVPLLSALASLVNHHVRKQEAANKPVSSMLLKSGALLNASALNIDKAVQFKAKALQKRQK